MKAIRVIIEPMTSGYTVHFVMDNSNDTEMHAVETPEMVIDLISRSLMPDTSSEVNPSGNKYECRKQEPRFELSQTVYSEEMGRGVITAFEEDGRTYPIIVTWDCDETHDCYTADGHWNTDPEPSRFARRMRLFTD